MRKYSLLLLTTALLASMASYRALADDWHGHGDIRYFHEHDYDHWREGRWFQGFHEGRNGWWWIVGGFWYFYPAPVYPYPDPYTPPAVVIAPAPVAPITAPPSYVYYCSNPPGYYPYVPQCYGAWQRVASSAAAPPPVVQPPPVSMASPPPSMPPSMPPMPAPSGSQRETDDRQLNAFAVAFQNVDLNAPHARTSLKNLEKQVEAFRQSLFQRNYNAMDILKDAEGLEHRIDAQYQKLPKHSQGPRSSTPAAPASNDGMVPPPSSQPPPPTAPQP